MNFFRLFITSFVRNPVMANLIAVAICVAGWLCARNLSRDTFPETQLDHFVVTVAYPGASPSDVEESVCVKVEQAIQGVPGIWEIGSVSSEGLCAVVGAYNTDVTTSSEVLRTVQDRVNAIRTFPADVERPIVEDKTAQNTVLTVGASGDASEMVLRDIAQGLRDDLLSDPNISQVVVGGVRARRITVRVEEASLRRYGASIEQITQALTRGSMNLPAGLIRAAGEEIIVRTTEQRTTAGEFENLVVISRPDGSQVRLGQLGEIREGFEDSPLSARVDSKPGVTVRVFKMKNEDSSVIAEAVRRRIAAWSGKLPPGVSLTILADASRDVDARIAMLIQNGLMGIVLLMLCLLVFMDFRAALGVAMGLPVAMAGAILVMAMGGQSLNLISLFALIMADAIVLDDSIMIADGVLSCERDGLSAESAAIEGATRVAGPVMTASFTTIIMFAPLLFVEGVMGKLIYVLPVVVIASIAASLVEAFVILPAHLSEWKGLGARRGKAPAVWRVRIRSRLDGSIRAVIQRAYRPMIEWLMRRRWVVLSGSACALLVVAGLVAGGRTPFVMFPKFDGNSIRARIQFPEGSPAESARDMMDRLEASAWALNNDPQVRPEGEGLLVQHVYSVAGEWGDFLVKSGAGLCETNLELMSAEVRRLDIGKIMERWRSAIGEIPLGADLHLTREAFGPQQRPIEIRLLGDDLTTLRAAADELQEKLRSYRGVFDVDDDLTPGKREARITLKPESRSLGLTAESLATQLRQAIHGGTAQHVQIGRDDVRVVVSYANLDQEGVGALDRLPIRLPSGETVPFHEAAEVSFGRGWTGIGRQDGKRRVRVFADIDERSANAEQVVRDLDSKFLPGLAVRHPGVRPLIDGERRRIIESLESLVRAGLIALMATYAVLGAGLRSYVQPLVLMSAIPLALAGAVVGHWLMGLDLSLMSVFGMTSVAGIVVNDALVLIDQIKRNLAAGMGVQQAVTRGAESRVIAVFLTAITNVAGIAPLLLERSSAAMPLIPMAASVCFGLCFAMALTLLVVPAMFLAVNDLRRFFRWLRLGGAYPNAEAVEPMGRAGSVSVST